MVTQQVLSGSRPGDTGFADVAQALQECEEAVTACASVVFLETHPASKLGEVARDMDCVDVLAVTRRVLVRRSGIGTDLLRAQLVACLAACRQSYDFCSTHADESEQARHCSEATHTASLTVQRVLTELGG